MNRPEETEGLPICERESPNRMDDLPGKINVSPLRRAVDRIAPLDSEERVAMD